LIDKRSAREDELKPVVFLEQAVRDLEETTNFYVDQTDSGLEMRFLASLRKATSLLVANPRLGTLVKGRNTGLGVRWLALPSPFQKYLILYRSEARATEVIRVLHASRDIAEILSATLDYS
jgi:plasmid stabilization system protein ParE